METNTPQTELHGTAIWQDLQAYFKQLFTEQSGDEVRLTPEILQTDLEAYFKKKYEIAPVVDLLSNGYLTEGNYFVFRRRDFFPPPAQVIIEDQPKEAAV